MGPVRRNSASSFTGSTSSKPYVKTASERLRGSTSASAPVPCDSDEDVQILEDLGLPGSRKGKKPATPGQGPSERESKPQRPVSSGSSDTNRPKPESKGKDLKDETKKQSAAAEQTTSSSTMVDYYKVLELQKSASAAEIKKSYRRLALRWHPDKNPDNQQEATVKFRELSEAYEVLIDEKKRKIYDQYGKEGLLNAGRPSGAGHHHRSRGGDHHGAAFADFDSFFGAPFGFGFPGAGFAFRDPEEVFKEFFRSDPMFDLMDDMFASDPFFGSSRNRNNRGQRTSGGVSRQQNSLANPFFSPMGFGLGGPMGLSNFFNVHESLAAGGGGGGSEFFSTTTFGVGPGGQNAPNVKRTSTSTRVSNGKKIVTKKVIENGIETVTITENGVLKTKTVNGVPQAIAF